jgi:peptidoglycan/LPS O-acetylase OafA/YrhL
MENKKIIALGGLAATGYSIYAIGKLSDKIPYERLYVASALVLGVSGSFAGAWQSDKRGLATKWMSFVGGTIAYSVSRGIFKQNPKVSLIAGAVLALGSYYLIKNPNLLAPTPVVVGSNNPTVKPIQ